MALILVRGTGDVGSAVAHALFRAGHRVVLHDVPMPAHLRRGMSFTDVLFNGDAELDGVRAKHSQGLDALRHMVKCGRAIPVVDIGLRAVVQAIKPDVVVDARMQKRQTAEKQRGLAPLTIGLGPQFVAGKDADVAVETAWGEHLGAVIKSGPTLALAGEPADLGGHRRDRFVYAPVAGRFHTNLNIGDHVAAGEEVARVGARRLTAPLSGCLRGLTREGAWAEVGAKVIEVDPRGDSALVRGLGERPSRIAAGVLQAVSDAPAKLGDSNDVFKPFGIGALIGALGGLVGLGGAEFRLPALVGLFRFSTLEAIAANAVLSLVTVVTAMVSRMRSQGAEDILSQSLPLSQVLAGSVVGALFGSHLTQGMKSDRLNLAVLTLLVALGILMMWHGLMAPTTMALTANPLLLGGAGVAAGVAVGIVSSLLGVAGGELLIPTLVLLYGIPIKLAGTLSLLISIPTLLVALWGFQRSSLLANIVARWRSLLIWMALGSVLGAYLGSLLVGRVSQALLSVLLGLTLFISAVKTFRVHESRGR